MSVLNKTKVSLKSAYAEYCALCVEQGRTPEPDVNFEDAQDIFDTMQAMKESVSGIFPREERSNEGDKPSGII